MINVNNPLTHWLKAYITISAIACSPPYTLNLLAKFFKMSSLVVWIHWYGEDSYWNLEITHAGAGNLFESACILDAKAIAT